ncbi:zinc finger MYM-type protein 4 isoform X2 [Folsomia candida]|uniref:zinc finger MYM-type protein 4 isoform X2 n=1 Tax=Folsomia candida TaxID=158441 RepID=UPI001604BE5C|nr:zinc finger MYM-type protein 4 isoform X2 [Folsomia candida]
MRRTAAVTSLLKYKDHGGKRQIDGAKEPDDVATDIVDGKSMDKNDSSDVAAESDKEASKIADTLKTTETIEMDDADDENEDRGVRLRMDGIFEEEDDDEVVEIPNEESQTDDLPDIQSMLQMSFREGEDEDNNEIIEVDAQEESDTAPRRGRPRRAAAAVAANTIREISSGETENDNGILRRRGGNKDTNYEESTSKSQTHICAFCKKRAHCEIKIQQFGTEVFFCSNTCFSKHRQTRSVIGSGTLACANKKCGISSNVQQLSLERTYYWETMNFCSDRCVGSYQVQVGGRCATCSNSVAWLSLGKYCVRFGSDIRQFCCGQCLEVYKKNARVCFHCQLDIKRLGNVILANLPAKQTPKEFCSQDCVEMYVEQNIDQYVKAKSSQPCICVICGGHQSCFKELVSSSTSTLKSCSEHCWKRLLQAQGVNSPSKCEMCSKYHKFDISDGETTAQYVSTCGKVNGFCSPTCKNVFVLKNRQILSCISCKVKKYNYDLIQLFEGQKLRYAACSLNCLPCTPAYIQNLKCSIANAANDEEVRGSINQVVLTSQQDMTVPVISSVSSMSTSAGGNTNIYMDQPFVIDNLGNIIPASGGIANLANRVGTDGTVNQFNLSQLLSLDPGVMKDFATTKTSLEGSVNAQEQTDADGWNGVITSEDIDEIIAQLKGSPETANKCTMAYPKTSTTSTQTEESAIADMERIPLKTVTETKYVPFPMPIPFYIPVPVYLMETPIPYPFPLPIPVPIPIPALFNAPALKPPPPPTVDVVTIESDDVEMIELKKPDQPIPPVAPELNSDKIDRNDNASNDSESTAFNSSTTTPAIASPVRKKSTRIEYGIKAWKMSFGPTSDPINYSSVDLAEKLAEWVSKGTKPSGERYRADTILYLCICVQQHLRDVGERPDNIFYDVVYNPFVEAITNYAESDCAQGINTRIEDKHFWESQQLGDASPGVLLFTLVYILYKNFHLKIWEKHAELHFGQVKIFRKVNPETGMEASFLRIEEVPECEGIEIVELPDMSEKCPVRLLSLYISKCAHADGQFYKAIKSDVDLTESIWYSEESLDQMKIYQMLVRAMMIKGESD